MRGALLCVMVLACGPTKHGSTADAPGSGDASADASDPGCPSTCSTDTHSVLDCHGNLVTTCSDTDACDASSVTCVDACAAAATDHHSVGCEYYATDTENAQPTYCFAAFVANTWSSPAHLSVDFGGSSLTVASFARLPVGNGPSLTYAAYDPVAGLAPGQVAILFLAGDSGDAPKCPVPSAAANAAHTGTGLFTSFRISTDVPVVAYEINPYGGGSAAVTGASLLLPTSVWDLDYVAVNPGPQSAGSPSLNIIAAADGTQVTFTPNAAVDGGGGVPSGAANVPMTIHLNRGQQAQITQSAELTGSIIAANKPVGLMSTHNCMFMPAGIPTCDHMEQMVPPVHALGYRYANVMYRPRVAAETATFWRVIGAADGTTLSYSANVGGPATLTKGQAVTFQTGTPFVVESQDADHPFEMFEYMTSSQYVQTGYGDPDFVVSVPPDQYLSDYVFFADPTYPETNLVVIRAKGTDAAFHDVNLDCLGPLTNWQPVGDYEWARTDLMTGNFTPVGNCSTGRHEIKSDAPFGLWVWGWGTPLTSTFTANVSYGYPGGMNVAPINTVVIE
ncbi:MAG: IgGFc-binding protein [Kofleriaceae bacterium]